MASTKVGHPNHLKTLLRAGQSADYVDDMLGFFRESSLNIHHYKRSITKLLIFPCSCHVSAELPSAVSLAAPNVITAFGIQARK